VQPGLRQIDLGLPLRSSRLTPIDVVTTIRSHANVCMTRSTSVGGQVPRQQALGPVERNANQGCLRDGFPIERQTTPQPVAKEAGPSEP